MTFSKTQLALAAAAAESLGNLVAVLCPQRALFYFKMIAVS